MAVPKRDYSARTTRLPDESVPLVTCPSCDSKLTFIRSVFGLLKRRERWDQFVCNRCGTAYDYHHRTRTLKRT